MEEFDHALVMCVFSSVFAPLPLIKRLCDPSLDGNKPHNFVIIP